MKWLGAGEEYPKQREASLYKNSGESKQIQVRGAGWEKDEKSNKKSPKTCERWKDLSSKFPIPGFFEGWRGRRGGEFDRRLRSSK